MKPSMIEISMGHSLGGVSDSYFRPREEEVLQEYLNAIPNLTISEEHGLIRNTSPFQGNNTADEIQSIKQQYQTMSLT